MSAGTENKPEWENPWSTDDIRKNSKNWTLAGDSGLCNRLQLFSESVILKSDDVQKNLDSLIREAKAVNSRISNAVNEFLMLSNTQFVENRVYDEEIIDEIANDEKKSDEVEKSKEQKELEVLPRITTALQLGLKVIDEAFEKHEAFESESEKEDVSSSFHLPILEPKDIYLSRPLPFIIGSEKFMQNDRVGLMDAFSEDEKSEQDDNINYEEQSLPVKLSESPLKHEIDNELESEYKQVSKPFYPKDSIENENIETHMSDTDDFFPAESSSDYNDSDGENKEKLFSNQNQSLTKANDSFASELAAKLGISSPVQEQIPNKKDEPSVPKGKKEDQDEFFVNSYEDDEDVPFSKTKGLFSGGGRLFDDIDDDEDLFSEITKNDGITNDVGKSFKGHKKMSPKAASHSSSNIDENSQNLSPASLQTKRPAEKSKPFLFDDDEDQDQDSNDLFASHTKTSILTPKRKEKVDLFDETLSGSSTSLFDDISANKARQSTSAETTPKKSLPVGAVSLFGNAVNPMMTALKSRSSFVENEVNNEVSCKEKEGPGENSRKSSISSQTLQTKSKVESKKSIITDNFSGNDTDLFNNETNDFIFPETSPKKHEKKRPHLGSISLFDDDSDDSDVLFNTSGPSTKFEDKTNSTTSEKISQKGTLSNATSKNGQKSSSDLDGKEAKDIFSKITISSRKGTVSLFDDDDNESDDIFSVSSMKGDQSLSVGKSKSIFAKEDDLFAESFDDLKKSKLFSFICSFL